MDFFQIIDPHTLAPRGALSIIAEVAAVILLGVLVGAALHLVPAMLVPHSKQPAHKSARKATKTPAPSTVATPAPASTARGGIEATAPAKATAPTTEDGAFLDTVLDSFFAEQSVLDEALMDTAIATANTEKRAATKEKASTQAAASKPAPPARTTRSTIDADLAAKMMRGLGAKKRAEPPAATPKTAAHESRVAPAAALKPPTEDDLLDQAFGDLKAAPKIPTAKSRTHAPRAADPEDTIFDLAMQEATTKPTATLSALEEIDGL